MKMPHWPIYTGPNKEFEGAIFRTKTVLGELGNPQNKLQNVFHITGTKGKGSTAHFISNILRASGYSVNTYTSPHIYECNERILLNGRPISDDELYELTEETRIAWEAANKAGKLTDEPALFEALTCSAFNAFARHPADATVIEVGMGAINDATNVLDDNPPLCCVFTPIHLDHVKFLGTKIEEVAWNKSFLMKRGVKNVVLSSQAKEAKTVLSRRAKSFGIENIFTYGDDYEVFLDDNNSTYSNTANSNTTNRMALFECAKLGTTFPFLRPSLQGDYQLINASCAIMACLANIKTFPNITINSISEAIHNTTHIVRMQEITSGKLFAKLPAGSVFYVDGAHNQLAAHAIATFIREFKNTHKNFKICVAVARTKGANNDVFLQEFTGLVDLLICTRANLESIPEPPEKIASACKNTGLNSAIAHNIEEVINCCCDFANGAPTLLICTGSLYIARDIHLANCD